MKRILVVEDNVPLQFAYKDFLTKAGYTIIQANVGDQGLELAKTQKPDCIILDVLLPGGMDGITILSKLKQGEATKSIPVIMMTNVEEVVDDSLNKGAVWYFLKADTSLEKVSEKLKEILHE